jgi:hypothetical protein
VIGRVCVKCKLKCDPSLTNTKRHDDSECRCGQSAPASANKIGIKLRGGYYLCTLTADPNLGRFGNVVTAVSVMFEESYKFTVSCDSRPIVLQLEEGLDSVLRGGNDAPISVRL